MKKLILPVCIISGLFAVSADIPYHIVNIYQIPLKSFLEYEKKEITLKQLKNTGKKITYLQYKKATANAYIFKKKISETFFLKDSSKYYVQKQNSLNQNNIVPLLKKMNKKNKNNNKVKFDNLSLLTLIRYAIYNYDKFTVKDKNEIAGWILIKVKEDNRLDYLAVYSYLKVNGLTKKFLEELLQTVEFLSNQGLL